jgi:hypothetical protein
VGRDFLGRMQKVEPIKENMILWSSSKQNLYQGVPKKEKKISHRQEKIFIILISNKRLQCIIYLEYEKLQINK